MVIASRDYRVAPLSLTADVRFREWVREHTLAEARRRIDLMGDLIDASERRQILVGALELVDSGQSHARLAATPEGKRMLLWLSLLPNHPGITLEEAGELVAKTASGDLLDAVLDVANGLAAPPAAVPTPEPPSVPPPAPSAAPAQPPEDRRRAVFDAMCRRGGVTPKDLVDMPIGAAEALYKQETGAKEVNRLKLKAHLYEYAKGAAEPAATDNGAPPPDVVDFVNQLNAHTGKSMETLTQAPPAAD